MNFPIKCHWSLCSLQLRLQWTRSILFVCKFRKIEEGTNHTLYIKFIIYGPSKLPIFSLFIFSLCLTFAGPPKPANDEKASTEKRPKSAFLCKLIQATSSTSNIKVNVSRFLDVYAFKSRFSLFFFFVVRIALTETLKNWCRLFNGRKNSFVMHVEMLAMNLFRVVLYGSKFFKRFTTKLNQDFQVGTEVA